MTAIVKLTYNPYSPQLSILINGKQPPEYSRLIQYTNEDIWDWHDEFLNVLYSELRDDFYIQFVGTPIDAEIIRYQCSEYEYCKAFEYTDFIINDSLQKRLQELNQFLVKQEVKAINKKVIEAMFILPSELEYLQEDIMNIDIHNLFCSTHIVTPNVNLFKNTRNSYFFILTSDIEKAENIANRFNSDNPIFIINVSDKNCIYKVTKSTVIYETTNENLFSTIFDCFLWIPLMKVFRECCKDIFKTIKNHDTLKRIVAIDPIAKINVNTKIEVGKSNLIKTDFEPKVKNPPRLLFKVLDESIASTDGMYVLGKKIGSTKLEVYNDGSKIPFEIITIDVIQRNRIKKIILSDDELVLGEGDTKKIECDFSPVDADNTDQIKWKSTNESVVIVDSNGFIKCIGKGQSRIICTAENISAQCKCIIKPYLKELKIELPENKDSLILKPMEEYEIVVKKEPSDSIDSIVRMISSDCDIANVIGNRIIAKKIGKTMITVINNSNRVKISFEVEVSKKKGGLLKSIFGKK